MIFSWYQDGMGSDYLIFTLHFLYCQILGEGATMPNSHWEGKGLTYMEHRVPTALDAI